RANVLIGVDGQPGHEIVCQDISSLKKKRVGRKQKYSDLRDRIRAISPQRRTTLRYIAHAVGVPASTLKDYYKRGLMVKHNSHIKPMLTDANKVARVKWAMDFVRPKIKSRMYLLPGEDPPHRSTQSKCFIKKVMFLSALARPRWDDDKADWFDGKIGIWNFTQVVPATRSSRNRPAGKLELRPINVTRPVYKKMLIEHVIPAIQAKWPVNSTRGIGGLHVQRLVYSPSVPTPNSPDMNALDPGFFRSIQSLQQNHHSNTYEEIVAATNQAWHDVDPWSLEQNFLTLQCCFSEVIMSAGDNSCMVPHIGKTALKRSGLPPETVACDREVFDAGCALMSQHDLQKVMHDLAVETVAELEMIDIFSAMESLGINDEDVEVGV
ncbi:hypothetical protein DYB32_007848, partial [Aphanomyces invadans]